MAMVKPSAELATECEVIAGRGSRKVSTHLFEGCQERTTVIEHRTSKCGGGTLVSDILNTVAVVICVSVIPNTVAIQIIRLGWVSGEGMLLSPTPSLSVSSVSVGSSGNTSPLTNAITIGV